MQKSSAKYSENGQAPASEQGSGAASSALVVIRWALVIAFGAAMAFAGPSFGLPFPIGNIASYAALSILLVNALWQHMPLKASCAVAALGAGLFGVVLEAIALIAFGQSVTPTDWLVNAVGAIAGAIVGYPLIQKVDSLVGSKK